jgi:hypothetical protein
MAVLLRVLLPLVALGRCSIFLFNHQLRDPCYSITCRSSPSKEMAPLLFRLVFKCLSTDLA